MAGIKKIMYCLQVPVCRQNVCRFFFYQNNSFIKKKSLKKKIESTVLALGCTKSICAILWNHFYWWGSRYVGSQIIPGSLGRHFVGSVIGIILINIKKMLLYVHWDVNSWVRITNFKNP